MRYCRALLPLALILCLPVCCHADPLDNGALGPVIIILGAIVVLGLALISTGLFYLLRSIVGAGKPFRFKRLALTFGVLLSFWLIVALFFPEFILHLGFRLW